MLAGQMMNTQLTLTSIMEFAEKVYSDSEIVSVTRDNPLHRYTYAEAFRRVRKLANALSSVGLRSGDRVATLAWTDYRHFELYYGVSCSEAVCHTINPSLLPEQIIYILNHAEDKLLFTDVMFLPLLDKIQGHLPHVEKYIVLTDEANLPKSDLKGVQSYESFIQEQSDQFVWPEIDENTASSLCYTSGTTGEPKGVLYSHRSTVLHAYACALPDSMNLSVKDVVLPIVPMFHVNAWTIPYSGIMTGSKLVLPGPKLSDPETLFNLIENEGITVAAGVPTVWLALLSYLRENKLTLTKLKLAVVGGAACPLSIIDEFMESHGVEVRHAWGMTETSPLGTSNTLKRGMSDLPKGELDLIKVKQGRAVYGVELKICDAEGNKQSWDGVTMGELKVRGPWICDGYYKQDNSDVHDEDGWLSTGDVGCIDSKGYLLITDRIKDVIKSGGEWISSIKLENIAVGHPAVVEAAVIGIADPKWGERPLLLVVKKEGKTLEKNEILACFEGQVPKWWIPEDVVFVEDLAHTATGKLNKKEIRKQFNDYSFSNAGK
ncbi:MAG: acyl-CoA synthetase (AMP-forming)/AMP-acid ligase II [Chlamydiales bacterium]|jgi:acyl-CoA synthetase (AMP-forming)/AMP-acid ligase II